MGTRTIIPFGPQHPVLPEPIHIDLIVEDEKVVEAVPSIGFIHRGLERLVEKKDIREVAGRIKIDFSVLEIHRPLAGLIDFFEEVERPIRLSPISRWAVVFVADPV